MRNKCSPKELEIQGNVLRTVPVQELHVAQSAHEGNAENASFEDLLLLRCKLEAAAAAKRGLRGPVDPDYLLRRTGAKPIPDDRYSQLSLAAVRAGMERRRLLSHLSVQ